MQLLNLSPPMPIKGFIKYIGSNWHRNKDFSNISNVTMSHSQLNASEDTENLTFEGTESLNSNSIHNITKMRNF